MIKFVFQLILSNVMSISLLLSLLILLRWWIHFGGIIMEKTMRYIGCCVMLFIKCIVVWVSRTS